MILSWPGRIAAAASLGLFLLAPARAAEQPGVLWETTSQTVMEGMPMRMPPQTQKMCAAKEWTRPPAGGDPSCTSSNFKKVGPKATWTVKCTGRMEMTGAGEITFDGTDSYTGTVRFTADQMKMTVNLTGRKLGGCDDPQ
jgi:hypothetical protein